MDALGKWGVVGALSFVFIKWVLPFLQSAINVNSSRSDAEQSVYEKQSKSLNAVHDRLNALQERYESVSKDNESLRRRVLDLEIENAWLKTDLERHKL